MHLNILLFNLKADQYIPYAPQIITTSDSSLPMAADKYTKAITRAVPIVGIPVFADQWLNMALGCVRIIIDFRNFHQVQDCGYVQKKSTSYHKIN